jgi:hypothetical protein
MKYCPRRDPQKVSKPKYEAAVLHEHLSIGYPNSSTGSMHNRTALLTGEATSETPRPVPAVPPITPRLEPRLQEKKNHEKKNRTEGEGERNF